MNAGAEPSRNVASSFALGVPNTNVPAVSYPEDQRLWGIVGVLGDVMMKSGRSLENLQDPVNDLTKFL